jgi:cytosine/adenosine deaminase-related metal-dependent hydrolase
VRDERWHLRAVALPDGAEPADWWVAGGRLSAEPVADARELPGAFVAPGLVDAHVHLSSRPTTGSGCRGARPS